MNKFNETYLEMLKGDQAKQIQKKEKRIKQLELQLDANQNQYGVYDSYKASSITNEINKLKREINNLKIGHTGEEIPQWFQEPINKINNLLKDADTYIQKLQSLLFQMETFKDQILNTKKKTNTSCSEIDRTIQKISNFSKWLNSKK